MHQQQTEPSGQQLSADQLEVVGSISDLIKIFQKTLRAAKLYLPNNEILIKFRESLESKFKELFGRLDKIELTINSYDITFWDQIVYQDEDKQSSLAYKLYNDGIRKVTFNAGIDKNELWDFIGILNTNFEDEQFIDSDIVTLMWERDFKHINTVVVDDVLEDVEEVDMAQERIEDFIEKPHASATTTGEAEQPPGEESEDKSSDQLQTSWDASVLAASRMIIDEEGNHLDEIKRQIEEDSKVDVLQEFTDILFEIAGAEETVDEFRKLTESLCKVCNSFILRGQPDRCALVLDRLKSLGLLFKIPGADIQVIIDEAIQKVGCEDNLNRMLDELVQSSEKETDGIKRFFLSLKPDIVGILCNRWTDGEFCERLRSPQKEAMLREVITKLARENTKPIIQRLKECSQDSVIKLMRVCADIESSDAIPVLSELVESLNTRAKMELISLCRKFKHHSVIDILAKCINDQNPQVRTAAVRTLGYYRSDKVTEMLLDSVRREDFSGRQMEEKKLFFIALGRTGSDKILPFLSEILLKEGWIRRAKDEEMRLCAVAALGILGTRGAIQLLKEGTKMKSRAVREACIKHLTSRRS